MITITRRFEWDAAHRLMQHKGKCFWPHGHRYVAEITFTTEQSSLTDGMIADFGEVKRVIGDWIDGHLDHCYLTVDEDPLWRHIKDLGPGSRIVLLDETPTAENLAKFLWRHILSMLHQPPLQPHKLHIVKVKLWETPSCYAEITA